jgi:orotate phosphoribosyltransferase
MSDLAKEILQSVRRTVALQLWQVGAVKINPSKPFKLVSGNHSPIYVNCRQLISSVPFADLFSAAARILCGELAVNFDMIAGGETAGIPFAAFLSRSFGKPMIYVRKERKDHGTASLVEGLITAGLRVLLVEDLITDAGSKIHFIEGIRSAGGTVNDVLVVFDRMQGGDRALAKMNIRLISITDMNVVLDVAESAHILNSDDLASVRVYLRSPADWHAERSLPYRA